SVRNSTRFVVANFRLRETSSFQHLWRDYDCSIGWDLRFSVYPHFGGEVRVIGDHHDIAALWRVDPPRYRRARTTRSIRIMGGREGAAPATRLASSQGASANFRPCAD